MRGLHRRADGGLVFDQVGDKRGRRAHRLVFDPSEELSQVRVAELVERLDGEVFHRPWRRVGAMGTAYKMDGTEYFVWQGTGTISLGRQDIESITAYVTLPGSMVEVPALIDARQHLGWGDRDLDTSMYNTGMPTERGDA